MATQRITQQLKYHIIEDFNNQNLLVKNNLKMSKTPEKKKIQKTPKEIKVQKWELGLRVLIFISIGFIFSSISNLHYYQDLTFDPSRQKNPVNCLNEGKKFCTTKFGKCTFKQEKCVFPQSDDDCKYVRFYRSMKKSDKDFLRLKYLLRPDLYDEQKKIIENYCGTKQIQLFDSINNSTGLPLIILQTLLCSAICYLLSPEIRMLAQKLV